MNKIVVVLILALISSCQNSQNKVEIDNKSTQTLPNIVYILADDMGYGDISSLNPDSGIQTPHMDSIIENGIYFSDAHSNSSVCTPTRYGILTGRYAWKSRLKQGVLWGYSPPLIEKNRTTVASFLKENGYATACIGKWHLGLGWQAKNLDKPIKQVKWAEVLEEGDESNVDFAKKASGPKDLGFDYSYIIPGSLDMAPYVYLENDRPTTIPTAYTKGKNQVNDGRGVFWRAGEMDPNFDFENVLPHFTEKATSHIKKMSKNDKPFFLYFPLTAPHTPWLPNEAVKGVSEAGRYGDFVVMVDNTVGKVIEALKNAGIYENTLIIVTSDNGSHWTPEDKVKYAHRANDIYKGQKADIYEGGHRIPFIAQWPGKIKPGSKSDQVMCTTDLLATLSGIINKPLPKDAGEDSFNMISALEGTDKEPIRDFTIHHSLHGFFSIRKGKWKLTTQLGSGGFSDPAFIDSKGKKASGTLYDMEIDIEEKVNLYLEHPEIVEELTDILNKEKSGYE